MSITPLIVMAKKCKHVELTGLYDLVSKPEKFENKKVSLRGEFFSFTGLPLDYPEAMRSSEDYLGIMLSRPDLKDIPLVELKLALPLKQFKKNEELSQVEHGDVITLEGKVFSLALGEPWIEVKNIEIKKDDNECES